MLHVALGLILLVLVVGGAVSVLSRVVSAAFPHGGASSRSTGRGKSTALRSPASRSVRAAGRSTAAAVAHPTNRQIRAQAKADTRRAWTEVKATDWLEQQRHDRANGGSTDGGTATATRPTISQRLRLRPFTPADAAGANGNSTNGGPAATASPTARTALTASRAPHPRRRRRHHPQHPPALTEDRWEPAPHPRRS